MVVATGSIATDTLGTANDCAHWLVVTLCPFSFNSVAEFSAVTGGGGLSDAFARGLPCSLIYNPVHQLLASILLSDFANLEYYGGFLYVHDRWLTDD